MDNEKEAVVVTSATVWRRAREEGMVQYLPSGYVARLRPVGLLELVKRGHIPEVLESIVGETVATGRPMTDTIIEGASLVNDFLKIVCQVCFMEPRISDDDDNPGPDEISFYDVSLEDALAVLDFAAAPTRALEPFRPEEEADVEPVRDGSGDGVPSE